MTYQETHLWQLIVSNPLNIKTIVSVFVANCEACQHVIVGSKFENGGDKMKPIPVSLKTWAQLGIDLITKLNITEEGTTPLNTVNRTTQEVFLKTQEFHESCPGEDWDRKLNGILFTYRINKQTSTHNNPFKMMYGREPLIPWEMDNDLTPLDISQESPDLTSEKTIEKMENLHHQVLVVAEGNIKICYDTTLQHYTDSKF